LHGRVEKEIPTVSAGIFCGYSPLLIVNHHLHQDTMLDEYQHLADFACRRLDNSELTIIMP
jgi:hypothetical protein